MRFDNQYPTIIAERDGVAFKLYLNAFEASTELDLSVLDIWDSIKDSKVVNSVTFLHKPLENKIHLIKASA